MKSIGIYCAEVWKITKINKSRIKATEKDFWRRYCRLTIGEIEKYTNQRMNENRYRYNTKNVETTEVKVLKYFGHMNRMSDVRTSKKI